MNNVKPIYKSLNILLLLLTLFITICGICSFNTAHTYNAINQYEETIKMWGAGIYAHDSYFKAPIFIGSDFIVTTGEKRYKGHRQRKVQTEGFFSRNASAKPRTIQWD